MRMKCSLAMSLLALLTACSDGGNEGPDDGTTDTSSTGSGDVSPDTGTVDTSADDSSSTDTGAEADSSQNDTSVADTGAEDAASDTATPIAPDPSEGDRFCLVDEPAADALWIYGSGKRCYAITLPDPWDPANETTLSSACSSVMVNSVSSRGQLVDACPAEDIVGVCPSLQLSGLPAWQGYRTKAFVYDSPITPDVASLARNSLSTCDTQDGPILAPDGSERRAVCTGSATATFTPSDGAATEQTFTVPLCSYKRIADRIEYNIPIISDQGLASQRTFTLRVTRQAGAFDRVGGLGTPVGILNLGGFWQTAPGVTQGLEVTNFDENGAGLTATYDLQMSDVLNPARTATMRGTLQIAFPVGTP